MKRLICLLIVLCLVPISALSTELPDITQYSADQLLALWQSAGERLKEIGAYPYVQLETGSQGVDVTNAQKRLMELYFYVGELTGKFDAVTVKAAKTFEKANGIKPDGKLSIDDQDLLYNSSAVAKVTPTPSPSPTPAPTPIPESKAFYVTGCRLYKVYDYMRFQVNAKNISQYTVDAFDVKVRAYNNYGEALGYYGDWLETEKGYTENDTTVKPGRTYKSGSYYWDLFGFDTATKIEVAVYRYHTADGQTVVIDPADYIWVSDSV